jgi:hypothetical protein
MNFSSAGKTVSMLVSQFAMIALLAINSGVAAAVETELHAEQWELARNGERLLGIGGIAEVVSEWTSDKRQKIELQYPGGEEGELWVSQLTDWLVALGIPSISLVAVPGSGKGDIIRLRVIRSGEKFR